jgi:diguanylate cyclase (GGDEF)-like protein/PAS domain S-box-containing protein
VLRFTNAAGYIVREGGAPVGVADREYFKVARMSPDRLVVSEPLEDRISGTPSLVLARARSSKGGTFDGVAYATLSSDYFIGKFKDVDIGPQGAVTLRTAALNLVARHTPSETMPDSLVGTKRVSEELQKALAENAERGVFMSRTAVDHVQRVNAFQKVSGYPLIVLVGLGADDFFAPWRKQAWEVGALCALLGVVVVALSCLAHWAHARHVAVQRQQLVMLDNELVGMVRLRDRRAVWHNAALAKLFGYDGESLVGFSARMLHADDATFERVGKEYAQIAQGGSSRAQIQMRRKDGRLLWVDLSGTRLDATDSLWMMVDITAIKNSETDAHFRAQHDPLTGLFNRGGAEQAISDLCRSNQRGGTGVAICYMDLDGFKAVNDQHGHDAGDVLLREAASRIAACTRAGDVAARVGGDEFVAAVGQLASEVELQHVLDRFLSALSTPYALPDGTHAMLSASIGAAWVSLDCGSPAVAVSKADQAMYHAKQNGKNQSCIAPADD